MNWDGLIKTVLWNFWDRPGYIMLQCVILTSIFLRAFIIFLLLLWRYIILISTKNWQKRFSTEFNFTRRTGKFWQVNYELMSRFVPITTVFLVECLGNWKNIICKRVAEVITVLAKTTEIIFLAIFEIALAWSYYWPYIEN